MISGDGPASRRRYEAGRDPPRGNCFERRIAAASKAVRRGMSEQILESLSKYGSVQWAAALAVGARATTYGLLGRDYRAFADTCWVARVSTAERLRAAAHRRVLESCNQSLRNGRNPLVDAYRADSASNAC